MPIFIVMKNHVASAIVSLKCCNSFWTTIKVLATLNRYIHGWYWSFCTVCLLQEKYRIALDLSFKAIVVVIIKHTAVMVKENLIRCPHK